MKLGKSFVSICFGILLASCNSDTQLAEGGITGSGISVGPITAFGSVWVGGVRYDTSNAEFIRNGRISTSGQEAFHVGEIVNIMGDVNADGISGVAKKITFDRNLSGIVTEASTDGKNIRVLDQLVETDILSLFSGFSTLAELKPGNVVEISATRTPDGTWLASTINLLQGSFVAGESELEVEGRISTVHAATKTFKVGDLTVNYAQSILNGITDLTQASGQYIEVHSEKNLVNGQLVATKIEPKDEFPQFAVNSHTTLDGRITDFSNNQVFTVNGQDVVVTNTTGLINGDATDIGLNAHLSVEGLINSNGILEADEITIRQSADPTKSITLEAAIEAIDIAAQTLTILGNTAVIDTSTLLLDYNLTEAQVIKFTDLIVGNSVRISGRKIGDNKISVLRIDRNPPDTSSSGAGEETSQGNIIIIGVANNFDKQNLTIAIGDTHIITDSKTSFVHPQLKGSTIDAAAFFQTILHKEKTVQIKGHSLGNGWIKARSIRIAQEGT